MNADGGKKQEARGGFADLPMRMRRMVRCTYRRTSVTSGCRFAICHLLLAILALALLWPVVQHPGWWIWKPGAGHTDLAVTHWPNAHFTRRALWDEGRFPLWRPTLMSGTPFAANPLAGLHYPPNWLFLFLPWLPLDVGFNLSALAHLWLAGAAMVTLMRRGFGTGVWGALAAAVAYEASPKLLAHLGAGHVGWVQAWGWLPLVVLCWLKIRDLRFAILGGVVLAMQFCADVRMATYTLIACVWLLVTGCWKLDTGTPIRQSPISNLRSLFAICHSRFAICSFVIGSLVIFLGLSACQWLPLVALLPETTRSLMTWRDAAAWSLPGRYLAGLLLADHGGFHEWMTYVGVSTLVLAGAGVGTWWHRPEARRWIVWLAGLFVGATWFSLGENGGLFQALWRVVPALGLLRVPPRAWVLVAFAAAVLAGLGVEGRGGQETRRQGDKETRRQGDEETRRQGDKETRSREHEARSGPGCVLCHLRSARGWRRVGRWLALWAGAFPPLLVVGYRLFVGAPPLNLVMFGVVTPLAIAILAILHSPFSILHSPLLGLAAVVLIAVDLLVVDATLIEARSPQEVFSAGRAAAAWLAAQPGRFRVYSPSYSIPQHVAELDELDLADGVDPIQLRAYADYLTRAAGLEPQGYRVTLPPFPEGADVRTALKDVLPDTKMLGRLGVRYVAAAFPIVDSTLLLAGEFDGVYVYRNEQARPVAEAEGDGVIALSDGTTLFRYRPWPVYAGWAVSGATAAGLVAAGLVRWRRRRRADG